MELAASIEELRTFVPAEDFALSREFYRVVGFREAWSSNQMVLLELGRFSFFLQNYFVKTWAENMVLELRVVDADGWWAHLQSLSLVQRFPGVRVGALQDDPAAGIRRGHFVDPSGVLWHVTQGLASGGGSPRAGAGP